MERKKCKGVDPVGREKLTELVGEGAESESEKNRKIRWQGVQSGQGSETTR